MMFPLNFPENQIPDLSFLDCFHGKCVKQIPVEVALSYPCDKQHNNCHVKKHVNVKIIFVSVHQIAATVSHL